MGGTELLQDPNCDPSKFLDWVTETFGCKNDAALCHALTMSPPVISKMRTRKIPIGPTLLVRVSDYTGMGTLAIKQHMFREVSA